MRTQFLLLCVFLGHVWSQTTVQDKIMGLGQKSITGSGLSTSISGGLSAITEPINSSTGQIQGQKPAQALTANEFKKVIRKQLVPVIAAIENLLIEVSKSAGKIFEYIEEAMQKLCKGNKVEAHVSLPYIQ